MAVPMPPVCTPAAPTAVYVAAVPLRGPKGPAQLLMSAGYSLGLWDLQHFMVLLRPDPAQAQAQALVFDFQPRDPEDALAALAVLSRSEIPGMEKAPALRSIDSCCGNLSCQEFICLQWMPVQAWFVEERCGGFPTGGAGSSGDAATGGTPPWPPPTASASSGRPAWWSGSTTAGTTPMQWQAAPWVSWDMITTGTIAGRATFVHPHQAICLNPRNNKPIAFAVLTGAMMMPTNGGSWGVD
ncbi:hypothetical protein U9M48_022940 [Paspalum notatum var. saurae]|uniref:Uncharacterized protein n=1 Tax=Paspalum notatum var. saurae TaxID=547442 RepID=A0AAQ3TJJ1_PASNO